MSPEYTSHKPAAISIQCLLSFNSVFYYFKEGTVCSEREKSGSGVPSHLLGRDGSFPLFFEETFEFHTSQFISPGALIDVKDVKQ